MTWSDPIVDEVRRARDAYAARFNYDLRAIFRDLKAKEQSSGLKVVSYAKDSLSTEPIKAPASDTASGIPGIMPPQAARGVEKS